MGNLENNQQPVFHLKAKRMLFSVSKMDVLQRELSDQESATNYAKVKMAVFHMLLSFIINIIYGLDNLGSVLNSLITGILNG